MPLDGFDRPDGHFDKLNTALDTPLARHSTDGTAQPTSSY